MENYEKKYKEVLEKAKALYKASEPMSGCNVIIETLFPELKESEDEKVRKALIDFFGKSAKYGGQTNGVYDKDILAWLERQGEQIDTANKEYWRGYREGKKLILDKYAETEKQNGQDILEDAILDGNEDGLIAETIRYKHEKQSEQKSDKVEPKFKVGDWIISPKTGNVLQIKNVLLCGNKGNYEFDYSSMPIESVDKHYHLWTLEDAKDGDVLACNEEILLFKSYSVQGRISLYCWYNGQTNNFHSKGVDDTLLTTRNKIYPATKEQRDLLFQKMKEAGYEWDVKNQVMTKIEQKPEENKGNIGGISANWSEDDETKRSALISLVKEIKNQPLKRPEDWDGYINWLQSLKDRVQLKQEWSEEDEQILQGIWDEILANKHDAKECEWKTYDKFLDWLKSLRPQNNITDEELAQAKKDAYNDALDKIEYHSGEPTFDDGWSAAIWYLKKKNAMPQTQWKPSDNELEVLRLVAEKDGTCLMGLYEQLKKLKEG